MYPAYAGEELLCNPAVKYFTISMITLLHIFVVNDAQGSKSRAWPFSCAEEVEIRYMIICLLLQSYIGPYNTGNNWVLLVGTRVASVWKYIFSMFCIHWPKLVMERKIQPRSVRCSQKQRRFVNTCVHYVCRDVFSLSERPHIFNRKETDCLCTCYTSVHDAWLCIF